MSLLADYEETPTPPSALSPPLSPPQASRSASLLAPPCVQLRSSPTSIQLSESGTVSVSFSLRGLVSVTAAAQQAAGGWGSFRKAITSVVGESQERLQLTLESNTETLYVSELLPDVEGCEEAHFSRVACILSSTVSESEHLRLVLWSRRENVFPPQDPRGRGIVLGELAVTLRELTAVKEHAPYVRRLQSEKYLAAEVLVWCVSKSPMNAISLTPSGMASSVRNKFNPMVETFTFIKSSPGPESPPPPASVDLLAPASPPSLMTALPPVVPGGKPSGKSLVTVRELTVEPKFAVTLPLQLLRPLNALLKTASLAWESRLDVEKVRQGYFASEAEAFDAGRVLVKVCIAEGKQLDNLKLASLEIKPGSPGGGRAESLSVPPDPNGAVPSEDVLPTNKKAGASPTLRLSDMKKFGSKAMVMAKNATQANVSIMRFSQGEGGPNAEKLKKCNYFATLHYHPPVDTAARKRPASRLIGKTNTEYVTACPVWNTNTNKHQCSHNQPHTPFMVAGSARAVPLGLNHHSVELMAVPAAALELCFYAKESDLEEGGTVKISLFQETYGMRAGLVETCIGHLVLPLAGVARNREPHLQWQSVEPVEGTATQEPAFLLVGVRVNNKVLAGDVQFSGANAPNAPRSNVTVDTSAGAYDVDSEGSDSEDSDAGEGKFEGGAAAIATPIGPLPTKQPKATSPANPLVSRAPFDIKECYDWMKHVGKWEDTNIDLHTLADLFEEIEYPLAWCEVHARAMALQAANFSRIVLMFDAMKAERTFRSSQDKKTKDLQFMATNLHTQIWSVDSGGGTVHHYDLTTTGAPAAHSMGFKHGGLVNLQRDLCQLKHRVLELRQNIDTIEDGEQLLMQAMMEYEIKSLSVSIRRAVVTSQVVSILACNIATKIEMMALGKMALAEELATKWARSGYLISFEGLLSTQGKEHGMVEDTVSALEILETYSISIQSWTGVGIDVGLDPEARVIKIFVDERVLASLPAPMHGGKYAIRIRPIFFTQGIDINQSMANQANSKTKGGFQADINAGSFARLNEYFHAWDGTSSKSGTHPQLIKLEAAVSGQQLNQKNTAILLESERAVQLVGGGRVTFCKSGKDRTAMSVTLEEAFIVVEKHLDGVGGDTRALRVANVLRTHGTRIAVAEKNIGRPQYSFNAIQRQFIPELYRAPMLTIQDVLTSFQKRDS